MRRFRLVALGLNETVVTVKRRYRAQVAGKLAAIAIPTAEMRRLWVECNGNMEVVLGPIRQALNDAGYSDLFILPAQTTLVELSPVESADETPDRTDDIADRRTTQLEALLSASKGLLKALNVTEDSRGIPTELATSIHALSSLVAQIEVELWER